MRRSKVPGPARSPVNSTARRRGEAEPSPTTPRRRREKKRTADRFTQVAGSGPGADRSRPARWSGRRLGRLPSARHLTMELLRVMSLLSLKDLRESRRHLSVVERDVIVKSRQPAVHAALSEAPVRQ